MMKTETIIPLTASVGFALALMLGPARSVELTGMYNASDALKAFRRIGNAELDNGQIAGTITTPDGSNLRYTADLMLCETKDECGNILIRYDLELPSKRAAFCLIDAWGDPKDKFGARPVFDFSAVRFMKDVTGFKGSDSPSVDKLAAEWKTELVDFHSLAQSGKC